MTSPWINPPIPLRTAMPRMPYAGGTAWSITLGALPVGTLMTMVGTGLLAVPRLGSGPRWAMTIFGLITLLAGLRLLSLLIAAARRRQQCAKETLTWRRDYPWPTDTALSSTRGLSCRLHPAHQPLAPGKTVGVTLEVAEPSVELTLRGVYETARWNHVGTNAPKIKTSLFYREQLGHFHLNDGRLRFDLAIPVDAPTTHLSEPPLTYWELIVRSQDDKESIILLPVYPTS